MSTPQTIAALQAAQFALNQIPRKKLPAPYHSSYAVAAAIDKALEAEGKSQEPTGNAPNGVYSLCEAVADLSAMFTLETILPADSREQCRLCIEWAQGFEQANAGHVWGETDDREYIEEIEKWFARKYGEWVSYAKDVRENDAVVPAGFASHAIANAARICIELPESMQASAILNEDVQVAARALAVIETGHGFDWANERRDWESTCAMIASLIARGTKHKPWNIILPGFIRRA